MIRFIKEHIIHRFEIPQSITTDQGTMFIGEEMNYFAADYGYNLLDQLLSLPKPINKQKHPTKC